LGLGWLSVAQCPVSADEKTAEKRALDIKNLHGRWRVDHLSVCDAKTGKVEDLLGNLKHELVITDDDSISMKIETIRFYTWKVEYDVKKTPVWIDLLKIFPRDDGETITTKGLLELNGDDLIIHLADPDSETRPTDFKQHKGSSSMLIKCKREKE
jgi:uncharacterized protein (TIGR03067 family)